MTNIQPRHRIGKEAAEARILGPEALSRLIHLSLACDQCRKTKSKCERSKSDDDPCKSCLAAGTGTCPPFSLSYPHHQLNPLPACTFLGIPPLSHPAHLLPSDRSLNRSELQTWPSQGLHPCHRATMASGRIHPRRNPVIQRSSRKCPYQ